MVKKTNLNLNPYYDDYDESKKFYQILFKPALAVQARELTQLQTILQNQIDKFGSHIFEDGSIVLNGQTSETNLDWIDVTLTSYEAEEAVGKTISQNNSSGVVLSTKSLTDTTARLYFNYTSGEKFERNSTVSAADGTNYKTLDSSEYYGKATAFSIVDSVFFVRGYFVFCEAQTIILSDDGSSYTKKVGLEVEESIVNYTQDTSLLEPSFNSYSYLGPGADRFTISLTLASYTFDPQAEEDAETDDFIELARFVNGSIVSRVTFAEYADLEVTLARRTYDESGDYTVRPFGIKIRDHIYGSNTKHTIAIDPGKAYVKGYEFETIATQYKDVDRSLATQFVNGKRSQTDFGNYLIINTPSTGGTINYNNHVTVNLQNGSSAVVGSATVRAIEEHSAGKYRLFVYNVSMSGDTLSNVVSANASTGWSAGITETDYTGNTVALVSSYKRPNLIVLPNQYVQTLKTGGDTDTSYNAYRAISASFGGTNTAIITVSGNESFLNNSSDNYLVWDNTANSFVSLNSVSGSDTSKTLTTSSTISDTATVYTQIGISTAVEKVKTLTSNTQYNVPIVNTAISLNKSDGFELVSIVAQNTVSGNTESITNYFNFNNGQKDELYDHASVKLKSGISLPITSVYTGETFDTMNVSFTYFTQNKNDGFFSVDSYSGIDYEDIPEYISATGEKYNLRDCIDFRPRRSDDSTSIVGSRFIVFEDTMTNDYNFYLGRYDKLVLTKERKFHVVKGISAQYPTIPRNLPDAMTLYILKIPPYTSSPSDISYTFIENKRYTMRDIGKIEKRVERMEYYTSLSLLEKQVADETLYDDGGIERFKNGILVDGFAGHSVGDVSNADYKCSVDPENRILRPRFSPYSFGFKVNSIGSALKRGDIVSLPYTTEVLVNQPFATNFVNLNPYMVFSWNGIMSLTPATDTWIDTQARPDVTLNLNGENDAFTVLADTVENPASVGVRWNDWQTVNRGVTVDDNYSTQSTSSSEQVGFDTLTTTNTLVTNQQTTTVDETLIRTGLEISTGATSTIITDLGNRVVDTSIVPFIRTRPVVYVARNLKPYTELKAAFDNVEVSSYCYPAVEIHVDNPNTVNTATQIRVVGTNKTANVLFTKADRVFVSPTDFEATDYDSANASLYLFQTGDTLEWFTSTWTSPNTTITFVDYKTELKTNDQGDIVGTFVIPNNSDIRFRTGERTFKLADVLNGEATTAAATKYVASGLSQSVERTILSTRVSTVAISPTLDINNTQTSEVNDIVVSDKTEITRTTIAPVRVSLSCNNVSSSSELESLVGGRGIFEYDLELGANSGGIGLAFTVTEKPVRYTIIYDGRISTTGFTGNTAYNDQLESIGLPRIANTSYTVGDSFNFTMQKNNNLPQTAKLKIEAPFDGTDWIITTICPLISPAPPKIPVVYKSSARIWFGDDTKTTARITLNSSRRPSESLFGIENAVTRLGNGVTFNGDYVIPVPFKTDWQSVIPPGIVGTAYKLTNVTFTGTGSSLVALAGVDGEGNADSPINKIASLAENLGAEPDVNIFVKINNGSTILGATPLAFNINVTWTYESGDADAGSAYPTLTASIPVRISVEGQGTGIDPVAQTFYIDGKTYPSGVFIDSLDLYFKKKSTTAPVTVQIRPVVNGYPSSSKVMPFGTCTLDASDITTSTDASVATNFKFDNIVHLSPGEYAFVVITNTIDYEIYTSVIGETSLVTGQRVTTQPTLGSMFKSQNTRTWTAEQTEDVMFKLYKCVFTENSPVTVDLDTDILPNNGDVNYDVFYAMGEVIDFATTNIDYYYKPNSGSWTQYQLGTNVVMDQTTLLDDDDPTTLQFRTVLTTTDSNITPVVDLNRLSTVLVKNVINSDITGETEPSGGNAKAKYITRRVKLNPGFESSDLRVYFNADIPTGTSVKVYYKASVSFDPFFTDNNYVEMDLESSGTYSENKFVEYKYKTTGNQALEDQEKFDTFSVKIVMSCDNDSDTTRVPRIKDLRVMALDL